MNTVIDILSIEENCLDIVNLVLLTLAILVISILFIIFVKFRRIMTSSSGRLNSISSQVYNSKHGDIEYLQIGEGPTILLSHGITGGVDQGIGLSKDYIGDGYRLLFISRFGYLKSSIPNNPSPELQAELYKELLDYLGIESTFIFGNSAGGTSAINFAISYPQNCCGLILISSNAPIEKPSGHPPKFVFKSNFLYWFVMKLFSKNMLGMFVPKTVLKNLSKKEINRIIDGIYF